MDLEKLFIIKKVLQLYKAKVDETNDHTSKRIGTLYKDAIEFLDQEELKLNEQSEVPFELNKTFSLDDQLEFKEKEGLLEENVPQEFYSLEDLYRNQPIQETFCNLTENYTPYHLDLQNYEPNIKFNVIAKQESFCNHNSVIVGYFDSNNIKLESLKNGWFTKHAFFTLLDKKGKYVHYLIVGQKIDNYLRDIMAESLPVITKEFYAKIKDCTILNLHGIVVQVGAARIIQIISYNLNDVTQEKIFYKTITDKDIEDTTYENTRYSPAKLQELNKEKEDQITEEFKRVNKNIAETNKLIVTSLENLYSWLKTDNAISFNMLKENIDMLHLKQDLINKIITKNTTYESNFNMLNSTLQAMNENINTLNIRMDLVYSYIIDKELKNPSLTKESTLENKDFINHIQETASDIDSEHITQNSNKFFVFCHDGTGEYFIQVHSPSENFEVQDDCALLTTDGLSIIEEARKYIKDLEEKEKDLDKSTYRKEFAQITTWMLNELNNNSHKGYWKNSRDIEQILKQLSYSHAQIPLTIKSILGTPVVQDKALQKRKIANSMNFLFMLANALDLFEE